MRVLAHTTNFTILISGRTRTTSLGFVVSVYSCAPGSIGANRIFCAGDAVTSEVSQPLRAFWRRFWAPGRVVSCFEGKIRRASPPRFLTTGSPLCAVQSCGAVRINRELNLDDQGRTRGSSRILFQSVTKTSATCSAVGCELPTHTNAWFTGKTWHALPNCAIWGGRHCLHRARALLTPSLHPRDISSGPTSARSLSRPTPGLDRDLGMQLPF